MTELRISPQPVFGLNRPLTTPAAAVAAPAAALSGDRYDPVGGNGPEYQALLQQTDQMMASRDPQQIFQAIINMTRMQPADALPRLQRVQQTPGLDPRVYELAQRGAAAMQGMAQQPGAAVPGAQPQPGQQPAAPFTPLSTPQAPTYQGAPVPANLNPNDAQMLIQNLRSDLDIGGQQSVDAIKQLMGIANAQPAQKELVFTLLLNHLYKMRGISATEALKALVSMNDPRLAQYLPMVQRDSTYSNEAVNLAVQTMQRNAANAAGPGVAQAGTGGATVELLRAWEFEAKVGGTAGAAYIAQIRSALGANPAQSPLKAEAMRIALTLVAKSSDPYLVIPAINMLGEIKSREMNSLDYLSAVTRNSSHGPRVQAAAKAAINNIMMSP